MSCSTPRYYMLISSQTTARQYQTMIHVSVKTGCDDQEDGHININIERQIKLN